jgi:hypothetical protein
VSRYRDNHAQSNIGAVISTGQMADPEVDFCGLTTALACQAAKPDQLASDDGYRRPEDFSWGCDENLFENRKMAELDSFRSRS